MGEVLSKQEYIPVGCLPSAAVASRGVCVSQHALGRGVCVSQHALGRECVSQHALGRELCIPACTGQGFVCHGVSAQGYLPREYVSAQGGVCPGGVYPSMHWAGGSAQGGVCWGCLPGGVCLPRGCQTPPPPVNRMTDRCL